MQSSSEKAMAPHSSTLAWKIPWTEEPGRLQSMGSQRVRHTWATSLSLFTFMHWRRKWQPTPVFLLGKSQGRGSLVGCHLWGRTESDTTEATEQQNSHRLLMRMQNGVTTWEEFSSFFKSWKNLNVPQQIWTIERILYKEGITDTCNTQSQNKVDESTHYIPFMQNYRKGKL